MDEEKGEFRVVLRCRGIFEKRSTRTNDVTRRYGPQSPLLAVQPLRRALFKKYITRAVHSLMQTREGVWENEKVCVKFSPKLTGVFASGYVNTASVLYYFFYKINVLQKYIRSGQFYLKFENQNSHYNGYGKKRRFPDEANFTKL